MKSDFWKEGAHDPPVMSAEQEGQRQEGEGVLTSQGRLPGLSAW